MSIYLITGDNNLDHLVKVCLLAFFSVSLAFFPLL